VTTSFDRRAQTMVRIPNWAQPKQQTYQRAPTIGASEMTNIFAVVGEHRRDPDRLLVIGQDGNTYDYRVPTGQFVPAEPREDDWEVDTTESSLEQIFFDDPL